jgi:hypothetical protein
VAAGILLSLPFQNSIQSFCMVWLMSWGLMWKLRKLNFSVTGHQYINILPYRLVNSSRNRFIRYLLASTFPVVASLPLFRLSHGWCLWICILIPYSTVPPPISLFYVLVVLFPFSLPQSISYTPSYVDRSILLLRWIWWYPWCCFLCFSDNGLWLVDICSCCLLVLRRTVIHVCKCDKCSVTTRYEKIHFWSVLLLHC